MIPNNYPQPVTSRRTTKQRELILELVKRAKHHPAAEQVFDQARKSIPTISLATVYRNLSLLVADGKLREVQFAGDVTRYDAMMQTHDHFYCTNCRSVVDLPSKPTNHRERELENQLGATIERRTVDFYGLCSACNAKLKRREKRSRGEKQ